MKLFCFFRCALALSGWIAASARAGEVPAFPGAEGFGRVAKGGRGGDVYQVTTLADAGAGSLREAITSAKGPRTIVFEVAGTILLKSAVLLDKSFVTIAGQTAPGEGITLRDYSFQMKKATDVVVRYVRFRLGDENKPVGAKGGDDTVVTDDIDRVIFDHCSLSWAIDGTHDLRRGGNFTLQWCIISEALNHSLHNKGSHAMAASYRDLSGDLTLHHNLISTCRDRHPTLGSAKEPPRRVVDFRNNVIYNWSASGTANFADHFINCINNVWRPGPMSDPAKQPIAMKGGLTDLAKGHMSGNVFEGRDDFTRDNYAALDFKRWLVAANPTSGYKYAGTVNDWRTDVPADVGAALPETQSAMVAMERVLAKAGASLRRDSVDGRVVDDVRNRRGKVIDSQREVGGWPELKSWPAPVDTDRDGIPDAWEVARGLDPKNPRDGAKVAASPAGEAGYTNLENYLNSLVME